MPNFYPILFEFLVALAFFAMWREARQHKYLIWWALASLGIGATIVTGHLMPVWHGNSWLLLGYAAANSLASVGLLAGACLFRDVRLPRAVIIALAAVLALRILVPTATGNFPLSRILGAITIGSFAFAAAILLWSIRERLIRAAAFFLALRGVVAFALVFVVTGQLPNSTPINLLHETFGMSSVLLLLLSVFQRAQQDVKNQFRFLSISQEISASLQGVISETQVARRVIDILLRQELWTSGTFMLLDRRRNEFTVIASVAIEDEVSLFTQPNLRLPVDSGISGVALRTQRAAYTKSTVDDQRISAGLREQMHDLPKGSVVCIPLLHNGEVLGVLGLRHCKVRDLLPEELNTLESMGLVIGLCLANSQSLAALTYRASHDALTGLGNRDALHEYFRGKPESQPCTLILFDLDHFKDVNDSLGHFIGDQLLRELATRIRQSLPENVLLFRLGGDEFVVLYADDLRGDDNLARARNLAELIALPFFIDDVSLNSSASIGIAEAPHDAVTSHELLRCADLAMYRAKQQGTSIEFYDNSLATSSHARIQLLSGVAEGLKNGEFDLYYQPQIDIAHGVCCGCEALIRWQHPTRGLISAAEFMPMIETTDLIRPLTYRVIEIAARDTANWLRQGISMTTAINLSARNLRDPDLTSFILGTMQKHQLDPRCLKLEITETVLMKDPVAATQILQRLRDAGFAIALDDFGIGYSSLAYLARFPIHNLKIDRSFVRNMTLEAQSRSIVESTIKLAHALNLTVTAEGVERVEEATLLKSFNCDTAQGYLYSRPIPRADFISWWRQQAKTAVAQ